MRLPEGKILYFLRRIFQPKKPIPLFFSFEGYFSGYPRLLCAYCNNEVQDVNPPPRRRDEVAWAAIAKEHLPDCVWVRERAWHLHIDD
jgi:hypothetical protein